MKIIAGVTDGWEEAKVFMNGEELEYVQSVDTDKGEVSFFKRDKKGRLMFDEQHEPIIEFVIGLTGLEVRFPD